MCPVIKCEERQTCIRKSYKNSVHQNRMVKRRLRGGGGGGGESDCTQSNMDVSFL